MSEASDVNKKFVYYFIGFAAAYLLLGLLVYKLLLYLLYTDAEDRSIQNHIAKQWSDQNGFFTMMLRM